jgi:O-succinylbenzoate synthase
MIFNKIQFERYDIDLIDPLQNSQMTIAQRSGSIIKLFLDDACGRGEAAPLPPYSNESLMEISWGLEELKSALGNNANYSESELFDLFELYSNKIPTLHFALDMALYDIISIKQKISIFK